jgi:hypothetical protein
MEQRHSYEGESINRSQMAIKRKTCDIWIWKKKRFLSRHIHHQHWNTLPVALPVPRKTQHKSLLTVVSGRYLWGMLLKSALYITVFVPSFVTIGSGIQAILRITCQQFERLQYWYYWWEGFMKYAIEMTACGMIYTPSFIKMSSGVQITYAGWTCKHTDTHTYRQPSDLISLLFFQNKGSRLEINFGHIPRKY